MYNIYNSDVILFTSTGEVREELENKSDYAFIHPSNYKGTVFGVAIKKDIINDFINKMKE